MTSRLSRLSLRQTLSLLVLGAALLPLVGMALVLVFWLLPRLENQIGDTNRLLAQALAVQTEQHLTGPSDALQTLARRIVNGEVGVLSQSVLETYVASNDLFESIYLVDRRHRISALALPASSMINRRDYLGLDLSTSPLLARAAERKALVWSDAQLSPISSASVVAIAVPAGEGLVVGEISLSQLSEFVRRMAGSHTQMMVLDKRGLVVAHHDPRVTSERINFSYLPVFPGAGGLSQPAATQHFRLNHEMVVGTRVLVPRLDWHVVVTQPLAQVYRPVQWTAGLLAAMSLLVAIGIWWLGLFVTRGLAGRFEALALASERLADGQYPVSWPQAELAEVKRLAASLERMGNAVHEREKALRDLNQRLEQIIAERSEALREAQASLIQSEKLAGLGALVAGVAHELNTPIGNALIAATTMEHRAAAFDDEYAKGLRRSILEAHLRESREATHILIRNLNRAGELIASFKQVAADQSSSQRRSFKLHDLVRENVAALAPSLKMQGCDVQILALPDVEMDSYPGPLGQVLVNLINNAMVHGYDGKPGSIQIQGRQEERRVCLTVIDHGAGISASNLPRIFDPFFTTRLGRGGSGLGLHVCYSMVTNLLGGEIKVVSEEGRGTSVSLFLPLQAPEMVT